MVILMEKEIRKVNDIIDEIRPFLMNDGGNISFVKLEENIVYISLQGACVGCPIRDITIKEGIEKAIISEIPTIKEVRVINED